MCKWICANVLVVFSVLSCFSQNVYVHLWSHLPHDFVKDRCLLSDSLVILSDVQIEYAFDSRVAPKILPERLSINQMTTLEDSCSLVPKDSIQAVNHINSRITDSLMNLYRRHGGSDSTYIDSVCYDTYLERRAFLLDLRFMSVHLSRIYMGSRGEFFFIAFIRFYNLLAWSPDRAYAYNVQRRRRSWECQVVALD